MIEGFFSRRCITRHHTHQSWPRCVVGKSKEILRTITTTIVVGSVCTPCKKCLPPPHLACPSPLAQPRGCQKNGTVPLYSGKVRGGWVDRGVLFRRCITRHHIRQSWPKCVVENCLEHRVASLPQLPSHAAQPPSEHSQSHRNIRFRLHSM